MSFKGWFGIFMLSKWLVGIGLVRCCLINWCIKWVVLVKWVVFVREKVIDCMLRKCFFIVVVIVLE